ncbi:MAG: hypothetical protein ACRCSG_05435 [Cellulosilyticaceae bacterium]
MKFKIEKHIKITIVLVIIVLAFSLANISIDSWRQKTAWKDAHQEEDKEKSEIILGAVFRDEYRKSLTNKKPYDENIKILDEDFGYIYAKDIDMESVDKYIGTSEKNISFILGGIFDDIEVTDLYNKEIIIPLQDLIKEYAPNIQKLITENSIVRDAMMREDGVIYSLPKICENPCYDDNRYLFINKTWLNRLGLKMPETLDEFYEILLIFRDSDVNGNGLQDEVPLTFLSRNEVNDERLFLGAFGLVDQGYGMMYEEGEWKYILTDERYKEYVMYIKKLYENNLLDYEVFTHDYRMYYTKSKKDISKIGAFIATYPGDVVTEYRAFKDYEVVQPLKGPYGHSLWNNYGNGHIHKNKFMITVFNKDPVKTIKWIDKAFDKEFMEMFFEKYSKEISDKNSDNILQVEDMASILPGIITEKISEMYYDEKRLEKLKLFQKKYQSTNTQAFINSGTDKECEKFVDIKNELDEYTDKMFLRWVSGEQDINIEWGIYIETIEKLGIDEYVALYNKINKIKKIKKIEKIEEIE